MSKKKKKGYNKEKWYHNSDPYGNNNQLFHATLMK